MRNTFFCSLIVLVSITSAHAATVYYDARQLEADRWQYTYKVVNDVLTEPIAEFTIWFEYGSYENLAVETASPTADDWNEIVLQSEPVLLDDGAYDAVAINGPIDPGQSVSGFTVSFDWLAADQPASQPFEIVDPQTFETIESGRTVPIPEPTTILLLAIGSAMIRRKARRA